jgi:predicted amidohydrolase
MEYAGPEGAAAETLAGCLAATTEATDARAAVHADLARRHRIHILAASGPERRPDGRTVNAARLFAPSGAAGAQDKLIMTPFERRWGIAGGEALRVFETSLGRIGVAICYDVEFPLLVRAQVEAGADLILVPSCTELVSGHHRVRTGALARALENGIVTAQASTVGLAPWSPAVDVNAGAAGVYVPAEKGLSDTGVFAAGPMDEPHLLVATVDLAHLARVRETGEMRNRLDWPLQPGARSFEGPVDIVTLM